jgi:hypothetical protein
MALDDSADSALSTSAVKDPTFRWPGYDIISGEVGEFQDEISEQAPADREDEFPSLHPPVAALHTA